MSSLKLVWLSRVWPLDVIYAYWELVLSYSIMAADELFPYSFFFVILFAKIYGKEIFIFVFADVI